MDENEILLSARELPHSIEAEQSVLGAIISQPSVLAEVTTLLKPEYFYNEQHKSLFALMQRMDSLGQPIDIVTLLNESLQLHIFENAAEGRRYLAEIGNMLPSTSNIASYCKIVADKYFIRSLSYTARSILEDIQSGMTHSFFWTLLSRRYTISVRDVMSEDLFRFLTLLLRLTTDLARYPDLTKINM